ncbi:uncharacterized protein METZ01_LOCUS65600 [marine metagenome]|uniref:Uncharacterized protein n=1 Tax=marine metagenome TaxID=408172 RepID=A0A381T998_9ZZZZ
MYNQNATVDSSPSWRVLFFITYPSSNDALLETGYHRIVPVLS